MILSLVIISIIAIGILVGLLNWPPTLAVPVVAAVALVSYVVNR